MQKLLDAYKTTNSIENAKKLQAYDLKHPFASCTLTIDDGHILNEAIQVAYRWREERFVDEPKLILAGGFVANSEG